MDTALQIYRDVVSKQPLCTEKLLTEALSRYRAGDEEAARTISGSCLRLAMRIAEEHARGSPGHDLLDLIQDANGGLMEAITSFRGDNLQDFFRHVEETIHRHLTMAA